MQKIRYIFGILIACMLILSHAQKRIVFTKVQCAIKSNKVVNVGCFLEENSAFTFQSTVGNKDVGNLVGIMELNLSAEGQRKVTRINGVRLDICKMLDAGIRPSMLSFIFQGIQQTDNNMPRRCPFKRNVTYILQHMKFDANSLPVYLPEYNFTFIGKFYGNNANLFDLRIGGCLCHSDKDCTGNEANRTALN
ncbi:uncharacterized protein LOC115760975 [Drosophila novamexicana]|uniref:uncharacterized protein LOC115760975 n=1 Tax=Drosophila novamexicana TaxID=47314 RepID=UPI0011E5CB85|nr:uncharacterized protein LOC115760975 [Drosophila novamexicana]